MTYFRRRLRSQRDNPSVPSIGLRDFCGDHITHRAFREGLKPREAIEDADPALAAARADEAVPAGQPDLHLLAVLKARSQRLAS